MRDFVERHLVLMHFVISVAIATLVVAVAVFRMASDPSVASSLPKFFNAIYAGDGYINLVTLITALRDDPNLWSVVIFAAAPTLAAVILAWFGKAGGLRALFARLKPIGPDGKLERALPLYLGIIAAYFFGLALFDWVAGPGIDSFVRLESFGVPVLFGALVALFADEGSTLEELGWRGFAWPLLLGAMRSPIGAAILLGFLHWAWHLPREVVTLMGGVALTTFVISQAVFLLLTIALAIIIGFCVNQTGGSVLPAIMVHGGTNVWSKAMGEYVGVSFGYLDLRTLIVLIGAVLVLLLAGRNLGHASGLK